MGQSKHPRTTVGIKPPPRLEWQLGPDIVGPGTVQKVPLLADPCPRNFVFIADEHQEAAASLLESTGERLDELERIGRARVQRNNQLRIFDGWYCGVTHTASEEVECFDLKYRRLRESVGP